MKKRWVTGIFLILILGIIVGATIIQSNKSEVVSFQDLTGLNEESITGIEFRSGGSGELYKTADKEKIHNFWLIINSAGYRNIKQPEPFTGYAYSGYIYTTDKKLSIAFAGGFLSLDRYYGIDDINKDFHQGLTKIIGSFKGSD